jgi:site-specific recombinase XerD
LSPAQQYERLHDFRAFVNDNMKSIGEKLGIPRLTSYVGRHSFATTLKNKGFEVAYISESLGHANVKTTQDYLGSFGSDKKQAAAVALDEL